VRGQDRPARQDPQRLDTGSHREWDPGVLGPRRGTEWLLI
jgi:hypothetical protein